MERSAGSAIQRIRKAAAPSQQPSGAPAADTATDPATEGAKPAKAAESGSAPAKETQQLPERRTVERRKPDRIQPTRPPEHVLLARQLFPRCWPFLPLTVFFSAIACALVASAPPDLATALALGASILMMVSTRFVYDLVIARSLAVRAAGLVVVVVIPLGLAGFGLTHWASEGGIIPIYSGASAAAIFSIAAIYLRRHPMAIVAAQVGLYAPMFVNNSIAYGLLGFAIALALALYLGQQQMAEQKREEEARAAQERINTRAQDILTDYEETGQGWFWETDRRSLLTYVSAPVAEALKLKPHKLIGQPLTRLFDLADTGEEGERTLMFHLSARSSFSELSVRAAIADVQRASLARKPT